MSNHKELQKILSVTSTLDVTDRKSHKSMQTANVTDVTDRNPPSGGKYQLFRPLPPDQFQALEADILKRGILIPVELDEDGAILDGHHRRELARELAAEGRE
jgi:hypothetical protein